MGWPPRPPETRRKQQLTLWSSSWQRQKLACRRALTPTPSSSRPIRSSRWRTPPSSRRTSSCKPDYLPFPPFLSPPQPLPCPPLPLPCTLLPAAQTLPCPPCSRLLRQQQEQGKSTMQQASRSSDPGLSSKDLTPWGRAPALTVVCAALLALSPKHNPPLPSPSPSPSPPLPLKKRPTPK